MLQWISWDSTKILENGVRSYPLNYFLHHSAQDNSATITRYLLDVQPPPLVSNQIPQRVVTASMRVLCGSRLWQFALPSSGQFVTICV